MYEEWRLMARIHGSPGKQRIGRSPHCTEKQVFCMQSVFSHFCSITCFAVERLIKIVESFLFNIFFKNLSYCWTTYLGLRIFNFFFPLIKTPRILWRLFILFCYHRKFYTAGFYWNSYAGKQGWIFRSCFITSFGSSFSFRFTSCLSGSFHPLWCSVFISQMSAGTLWKGRRQDLAGHCSSLLLQALWIVSTCLMVSGWSSTSQSFQVRYWWLLSLFFMGVHLWGGWDFHLLDRNRFFFSILTMLVNFLRQFILPVSHLAFESWGDEDVGGNSGTGKSAL